MNSSPAEPTRYNTLTFTKVQPWDDADRAIVKDMNRCLASGTPITPLVVAEVNRRRIMMTLTQHQAS